MNYTLILYKSDGYNTCRCCVMEQWGSDFSLDTNIDEDCAIKKIAETFSKPSDGGSYEANLIGVRNGQQVVHRFDQYSYYRNWRNHPDGGVTTISYMEDSEIDEENGSRINTLIRCLTEKMVKNLNK